MNQHAYFDTEQGKLEQRSELYENTSMRVAQSLTRLCAKSKHRVFGFAKKQVLAIGELK